MPRNMIPDKLLPHSEEFEDADDYVDSLLEFLVSSRMLQILCGGVHILDFMTREPDLYTTILPFEWREWLEKIDIMDFLELLMRDDIQILYRSRSQDHAESSARNWRGQDLPPESLLDYIASIRRLSLNRSYKSPRKASNGDVTGLSRRLAVGMKPKKAHEVENFAAFVDELATSISNTSDEPITHLVDFGSGQNYLGRVLASPLYSRKVIAVERKHLNVDGAKRMDISANVSEKEKVIWRNKKQWRTTGFDSAEQERASSLASREVSDLKGNDLANADASFDGRGKILYVEHEIQDGNLDPVVVQLSDVASDGDTVAVEAEWNGASKSHKLGQDRQVLCISLHSCGNLSHHGLRSLVLNPFVRAVALVGCCYNLLTERLGPPTYKLPTMRAVNKRLQEASAACDPHGFPMSNRLADLSHEGGRGIRLNITARMMAVQAPQSWTRSDCDSFFTRHFYRALLQRLFMDRGFVKQPQAEDNTVGSVSPAGFSGGGEPIILGSLRKSCYNSFPAYVRGALEKLKDDPVRGSFLQECMRDLTDEEISDYEQRFQNKRHHLCLVWSLMAFSAGVIESAIVTDRWLYLREQPVVKHCWVQTVFDYKQSPRNLAVIGIK